MTTKPFWDPQGKCAVFELDDFHPLLFKLHDAGFLIQVWAEPGQNYDFTTGHYTATLRSITPHHQAAELWLLANLPGGAP